LSPTIDPEDAEPPKPTPRPIDSKGSPAQMIMQIRDRAATGNTIFTLTTGRKTQTSEFPQLFTARGESDKGPDKYYNPPADLQVATERLNRGRVLSETNDEEEHIEVQSPSPIKEPRESFSSKVVLPHTARTSMRVTQEFSVAKSPETGVPQILTSRSGNNSSGNRLIMGTGRGSEPLRTQRGPRQRMESGIDVTEEKEEEGQAVPAVEKLTARPVTVRDPFEPSAGEVLSVSTNPVPGADSTLDTPLDFDVKTPSNTEKSFKSPMQPKPAEGNPILAALGTSRRTIGTRGESNFLNQAPLTSRLPTSRSQRKRNITLDPAEDEEELQPQPSARPIVCSEGSFKEPEMQHSPKKVPPLQTDLPPTDPSNTDDVLFTGKISNPSPSSFQKSVEEGKTHLFQTPRSIEAGHQENIEQASIRLDTSQVTSNDGAPVTERSARGRTAAFSKGTAGTSLSARFFVQKKEGLKLTDMSSPKNSERKSPRDRRSLAAGIMSIAGDKSDKYKAEGSSKSEQKEGTGEAKLDPQYQGPQGKSIASMGIFGPPSQKGH